MDRTKQVFEFIRDHIEKYGFSPTYREIAAGVGLNSSSTVKPHLDKLKESGRIEIITKNRQVRAIKILPTDEGHSDDN